MHGAAPRAVVPVSPAPAPRRAARTARSHVGRRRTVGKARSARNALKHGMRALNYVVLPDEDAVEFQTLEAALVEELAPEGALQLVLARRVAVAAWRLARADRMEVELFEERRWEERRRRHGADPRRQRHPQLRDLDALPRRRHGRVLAGAQDAQGPPGRQADMRQAPDLARETAHASQLAAPAPVRAQPPRPAARRAHADPRGPNEPERLIAYPLPDPPMAGPALHEPRGTLHAASPRTERTRDRSRSADIMTAPPGPGRHPA